MIDDQELLRQYAQQRSEPAFAEVVQRHLGLVYHAALRRLGGNAHLAQDVTQEVFADLARKAGRLERHPALSAWLHASTRLAALRTLRTERRRQKREHAAFTMNDAIPQNHPSPDWERLRPLIDETLDELDDSDREAVLLRFFEAREYSDIGHHFQLTADGARSRVERALDKLHSQLARRGITSAAGALGLTLSAQGAAPVPAGLNASVVGSALLRSSLPATVGALESMLMATRTVKIACGLAVLTAVGFLASYERGWMREMSALAPDPAPPTPVTTALTPVVPPPATTVSSASPSSASVRPPAVVPAPSDPPSSITSEIRYHVNFTNVGWKTPQDALETGAWAARTGDLEAWGNSLTFDDAGRTLADQLFAALPDDLRRQLHSPEQMWAVNLAVNDAVATTWPVAQKIIKEAPTGPDQVALQIWRQWNDNSEPAPLAVELKRGSDGNWRRIVSANNLRNWINRPDALAGRLSDYLKNPQPSAATRKPAP